MFQIFFQKTKRLFYFISFKDQYVYCYLNGLCTLQSNSDIQTDKMKENLDNLLKVGIMTNSKILNSHYEVIYFC